MAKIGRRTGPTFPPDSVPATTEAPPAPVVAPSPPSKSAKVAEWRAYAEAVGAASTGSKAELIARVG